MGWINKNYRAGRVLPYWATIPAIVATIFTVMLWIAGARGGYRAAWVA